MLNRSPACYAIGSGGRVTTAMQSATQAVDGLTPLTVGGYVRVARLFLCAVSAGEGLDLQRLEAAEVSGFVLDECRRHSVGSA
jgi:hypothetical protein